MHKGSGNACGCGGTVVPTRHWARLYISKVNTMFEWRPVGEIIPADSASALSDASFDVSCTHASGHPPKHMITHPLPHSPTGPTQVRSLNQEYYTYVQKLAPILTQELTYSSDCT